MATAATTLVTVSRHNGMAADGGAIMANAPPCCCNRVSVVSSTMAMSTVAASTAPLATLSALPER